MSSPANHPFATPNDYGPLTNVLNWILVVISALAVLSRVAIKVNVSYYGGDDTLILIALVSDASNRAATNALIPG